MAFRVEFKTDSATFAADMPNEISRVLSLLAADWQGGYKPTGHESGVISDENRNVIGEWEYTP